MLKTLLFIGMVGVVYQQLLWQALQNMEPTATLYITYSMWVCISSINTVFLKGYYHRSTPVHRSHHSCEEFSSLE